MTHRDDGTEQGIIGSARDGYVRIADVESLMRFPREADTVISVLRRPGHHAGNGPCVMSFLPCEA